MWRRAVCTDAVYATSRGELFVQECLLDAEESCVYRCSVGINSSRVRQVVREDGRLLFLPSHMSPCVTFPDTHPSSLSPPPFGAYVTGLVVSGRLVRGPWYDAVCRATPPPCWQPWLRPSPVTTPDLSHTQFWPLCSVATSTVSWWRGLILGKVLSWCVIGNLYMAALCVVPVNFAKARLLSIQK